MTTQRVTAAVVAGALVAPLHDAIAACPRPTPRSRGAAWPALQVEEAGAEAWGSIRALVDGIERDAIRPPVLAWHRWVDGWMMRPDFAGPLSSLRGFRYAEKGSEYVLHVPERPLVALHQHLRRDLERWRRRRWANRRDMLRYLHVLCDATGMWMQVVPRAALIVHVELTGVGWDDAQLRALGTSDRARRP